QFVVGARAAPVLDQEQAQVLLGRPEALAGIDRPQERILGDGPVECADKPGKGVFAADRLVYAVGFLWGGQSGVQGALPVSTALQVRRSYLQGYILRILRRPGRPGLQRA